MGFTDLFIRRPVLAIVLSLLLLLLGMKAFTSLQLRQYPEVVYPTVNITTAYPGANASLIKGFITTPILNAVTSVEGIEYLTAESNDSISTVSVFLTQDYDVDTALLDLTTKVNKIRGELPSASEDPLIEKMEGKPKIGMIAGIGDRRPEDNHDIGVVAAETFDEVIIRQDKHLRGKTEKEIIDMIHKGIKSVDPDKPVTIIPSEKEAITHAITNATKGSLLVFCSDVVPDALNLVMKALMLTPLIVKRPVVPIKL